MNTADIVLALETVFDAYIAQSPRFLTWTANVVASDAGISVEEASAWLQTYRDEHYRGNMSLRYVIGTTDRGPESVWLFLDYPGASRNEKTALAFQLVLHMIDVEIEEHVKPWVKTYWSEMLPAFDRNTAAAPQRSTARAMCRRHKESLAGLRRQLAQHRATYIRTAAAPWLGHLDLWVTKLAEVERAL